MGSGASLGIGADIESDPIRTYEGSKWKTKPQAPNLKPQNKVKILPPGCFKMLGFGVWGLGFGAWGLGFKKNPSTGGLGFGVWIWGLGFEMGFGSGVWGLTWGLRYYMCQFQTS